MEIELAEINKSLDRRVSRWSRINGIPVKSLYEYLPLSQTPKQPSDIGVRKLVWRFKGTDKQKGNFIGRIISFFTGRKNKARISENAEREEDRQIIIAELKELISETFREDTKTLMFLPIPCVDEIKFNERFRDIAEGICTSLQMENGFSAVSYTDVKSSGLLENVSFEPEKIKGKFILLFDDIVTTGRIASAIKEKLEREGANVVAFVTVSKTRLNLCQ